MRFVFSFFALAVVWALSACATGPAPEDAALDLRPAAFSDLPGWEEDGQEQALTALKKSCPAILKGNPGKNFGPLPVTYADWQPACNALLSLPQTDSAQARAFLEEWFVPWKATAAGRTEGLFTGYYEPALRGAHHRSDRYTTPLLKRPADLVMVELGDFRDSLKGQRIAGRVIEGKLKPYEDRAALTEKIFPPDQVLVWVDDPVDAFFLHIQGSGRVVMEDGSSLRVGYDGQNGHTYYAVGRELVKRGILEKDAVSMQSIRAWLETNPEEAHDFMNLNPSYIFFRVLEGEGPLGAANVALTAGRSLAVDPLKIAYGTPVWLDAAGAEEGDAPIRRLVVAQDTGGAIRGPLRGDFFWGYGESAAHKAGLMKSKGEMWLLLPRSQTGT